MGGIFLNVSNHPSGRWPVLQREAAEAMGHGAPVDLPGGFPEVDPGASTAQVEAQAEALGGGIVGMGVSVAAVFGEFTMTVALVKRLQAAGIECVCATTSRRSSERVREDGTIERTQVFEFVAWRPYPRIV